MCEVAYLAIMLDDAAGIQNARLPNPSHRSNVTMMANESSGRDGRADADRCGGGDNGRERPTPSLNVLCLRPSFAIVSSRGETLPAVRRVTIERLDDRPTQETLVVARTDVSKDQLLDTQSDRDIRNAAGMSAKPIDSQAFDLR